MTQTIQIKRLRGASIFKLCILGNCIGFMLLSMVLSIPAFFGSDVLKWNETYLTGVLALIAGPFLGAFIGGLCGLFSGVFMYVGLRVYALFRVIEIEYLPGDDVQPVEQESHKRV